MLYTICFIQFTLYTISFKILVHIYNLIKQQPINGDENLRKKCGYISFIFIWGYRLHDAIWYSVRTLYRDSTWWQIFGVTVCKEEDY